LSTFSIPEERTEGSKGGRGALFWATIVAVSLFVAIVYGVVFTSIYSQPIDAQGGIVLYLLALLTVLAACGIVRFVSRFTNRG
jgi:hypothetical protein